MRKINKKSTTIFFTDFPDHLRARDFYQLFKKFDEIDEVVIPPKMDKRGRKYGCVRFY